MMFSDFVLNSVNVRTASGGNRTGCLIKHFGQSEIRHVIESYGFDNNLVHVSIIYVIRTHYTDCLIPNYFVSYIDIETKNII